jgi:DNA-binding transcriptional ArsR family regulator
MVIARDFIVAPSEIRVDFKVNPVNVLINSLMLVHFYEDEDGMHHWIGETARSLSPEHKQKLKLLAAVIDCVESVEHDVDFPTFITLLKTADLDKIQQTAVKWLQDYGAPTPEEILRFDEAQFVETIRQIYKEKEKDKAHVFEAAIWHEAYQLIMQPEQLRAVIAESLQEMWDVYLAKEWKRTQALMEESAQAFSKKNYSGKNIFDIIETITGRDLRSNDILEGYIPSIRRMIFMPSPHLGPYITWRGDKERGICVMLFGARLPKDAEVTSSALNRSELLVRLNALADETRLRMLEMLIEREEICAQEFIDTLELSQSSASRHLRQLAASGFLTVRRKDVAKCYALNLERIEDTMKALGRLIKK